MKNKMIGLLYTAFICLGLTACDTYHHEEKISSMEWKVNWLTPGIDNHHAVGELMRVVIKGGKVVSFEIKESDSDEWKSKTIVKKNASSYFETGEIAAVEFYFLDDIDEHVHKASLGFLLIVSGSASPPSADAQESIFAYDIIDLDEIPDNATTEQLVELASAHGKGGGTSN